MYRSKVGEHARTKNNKKYSILRSYVPREVVRALNLIKGDILVWTKESNGFLIKKEDGNSEEN